MPSATARSRPGAPRRPGCSTRSAGTARCWRCAASPAGRASPSPPPPTRSTPPPTSTMPPGLRRRPSSRARPVPDTAATVENLRTTIAAERRPALLALRDAARARGVVFLHGEEQVSVGSGTGVAVWPDDAIPAPSAVDWSRVHDVPIALVTGSNGKTTTVRLHRRDGEGGGPRRRTSLRPTASRSAAGRSAKATTPARAARGSCSVIRPSRSPSWRPRAAACCAAGSPWSGRTSRSSPTSPTTTSASSACRT